MATTTQKKWTKDAILSSIKEAAEQKGDVPTSTDMSKRLYGLPYPQAVIDAFGSTYDAIKKAGFEPKGRKPNKAIRAQISATMKAKKNTTKAPAAKRTRKPAESKSKATVNPSLKSAVADTLNTAFARQQFCTHCETAYTGDTHTAEQCRDNLVLRVEAMRAEVGILPAQEQRTPVMA